MSSKFLLFSHYLCVPSMQDSELYVLVEKVDVGSPAHGKLHLGDWIRSVNGTPITDNKVCTACYQSTLECNVCYAASSSFTFLFLTEYVLKLAECYT